MNGMGISKQAALEAISRAAPVAEKDAMFAFVGNLGNGVTDHWFIPEQQEDSVVVDFIRAMMQAAAVHPAAAAAGKRGRNSDSSELSDDVRKRSRGPKEIPAESKNLQGLCTAIEENCELTMPEGCYLPFDAKLQNSKMLIRDAYTKLIPLINNSQQRIIFLSGTPGTGKSWSLWPFVREQLLKDSPPDIVWQSHGWDKSKAYLLQCIPESSQRHYKISVGRLEDFEEQLRKQTTWHIADGFCPDLSYPAMTLLVSSPQRGIYKEFLKQGPRLLFMPPWTEVELLKAAKFMYPLLTTDQVSAKYRQLGGVARGVLGLASLTDSVVDPLNELHSAIRKVSVDEALDYAQRDASEGLDDMCSRIYHFDVDGNFKSQGLRFASPYVECLLRSKVQVLVQSLGAACLLNAFQSSSVMSGLLFEEWAHAQLSQGIGNYEMRSLDAESLVITKLPSWRPLAIHLFQDDELADKVAANKAIPGSPPQYLRPANPRFPAVDSILLPDTVFQITVSGHKPAPDINKLVATLEKGGPMTCINMVYVVPADKAATFTAGKCQTMGVKQWVLGLQPA